MRRLSRRDTIREIAWILLAFLLLVALVAAVALAVGDVP